MLPTLGFIVRDFGVNSNAIQLVITSVFAGHIIKLKFRLMCDEGLIMV
jgi:hypothetical protein